MSQSAESFQNPELAGKREDGYDIYFFEKEDIQQFGEDFHERELEEGFHVIDASGLECVVKALEDRATGGIDVDHSDREVESYALIVEYESPSEAIEQLAETREFFRDYLTHKYDEQNILDRDNKYIAVRLKGDRVLMRGCRDKS